MTNEVEVGEVESGRIGGLVTKIHHFLLQFITADLSLWRKVSQVSINLSSFGNNLERHFRGAL